MIKCDILVWSLRKKKWNSEYQNQHFPKYVLQNVTEMISLRNAGLNQIKQVDSLEEFTGDFIYN